MGLFKSRKESKISKVEPAKLNELRQTKVGVLDENKKQSLERNKARLCYFLIDEVGGENNKKIKVEQGTTCVYKMPAGMKKDDYQKVISFLMDRYIGRNCRNYKKCFEVIASKLEEFGFTPEDENAKKLKMNLSLIDYERNDEVIVVPNKLVKASPDILDLWIAEGDYLLLLGSDCSEINIDWADYDVRFKTIKQIYSKCGLTLNKDGVVNAQSGLGD